MSFFFCLSTLQSPSSGLRSSPGGKAHVRAEDSAAVWSEIVSSFLEEPGEAEIA